MALAQTEDQQLLLNIARLRYGDRPLFLLNTSISDSIRINPAIGAEATFPRFSLDDTSYTANASLGYSEGPTVSYEPLQGKEFATQILSRIPLDSMMLLAISGWNVERVFLTCLESVNDIDNFAAGMEPEPGEAAEYDAFHRVSELLLALQQRKLIWIHDHADHVAPEVYLVFQKQARSLPEFKELTQLLRLDPERLEYRLTTDQTRMGGDTIAVRPRSFANVLVYLSHAVEVPAADEAAGRAIRTHDARGDEFGWTARTERLFKVHYAESKPKDTAVAVRYRGGWFYIDDKDMHSKQTFSMLSQLFAMQSKAAEGRTPLLTLPIGS